MKLAYTQHQGAPYLRQQDCVFNGFEVIQKLDEPVKLLKAQNQILIAVADGVSASPGAELASKFVLEALETEVNRHGFSNAAIRSIQVKLSSRYANTRYFGTSTTLLAVQFEEYQARILSVGDCRAYLIKEDDQLIQLTRDHSFINELVDEEIAAESIKYASCYNVLTDCLVADFEETDFKIFATSFKCQKGDRLLVCTDGVYETLESQLVGLIDCNQDIEKQAKEIRDAILCIGPSDNFSLVMVDTSD